MKVYCMDCKGFNEGNFTPVCLFTKQRYGAVGKEGYMSCERINKNNDCKDFIPKFWKRKEYRK